MASVWTKVQGLAGETLNTLVRGNPFTVIEVLDDHLVVVPLQGKQAPRRILRDRVEHMASLGYQKEELRSRVQAEFPDSQNTSYIAAVVYEVTKGSAK